MTPPSVLIVDDEAGLVRLFASIIEKGLGYQTIQAVGGDEAMRLLDEATPHLMLLDLAMPHVNGLQVLQYARRLPHLDGMRVVVLTARPKQVYEVESLGVDAWLTKPVTPDDILDTLRRLLADGHASP